MAEDQGLFYLNITDISREGLADEALVAADGLHPSGKMYARWAMAMVDQAALLLR